MLFRLNGETPGSAAYRGRAAAPPLLEVLESREDGTVALRGARLTATRVVFDGLRRK